MARPRQTQNRNQGQAQGQAQAQTQNGRPTRNITGPQSALTDFLATHNISARQIRDEAEQRRQRAAADAQNGAGTETEEPTATAVATSSSARRRSGPQQSAAAAKKKKDEQAKIAKIKASKAFQKRKRDADDSDEEDEIARAIFEEYHAPLPGQMENCAICDKRFTVTPYSVAAPEGGLLCAPCGREIAKEREGQQKKKKQAPRKQVGGVGSRRTVQSRMLDGDVGTKSLATLCVQTLAKNVEMADDLGDLPEHLIDKIARIFSKRRLLRPETLPLFVRPSTETLHIYDGSRLGAQELISIFQVAATNLKNLKIRCAIHFKDEVMDYFLSRPMSLHTFSLHGANLLSEEKWHAFIVAQGAVLQAVQVYYTDRHFGDDTIGVLKDHSPNLRRLKIQNNQKLTSEGVKAIGDIASLEHVGLQLLNDISSEALTQMVTKVGANLQTLSFKVVPLAQDDALEAIHEHCRALVKLRITDSERMTDQGFAKLFTDWKNPPLRFIDFQKCRHLDSMQPRNNPDSVGLCSDGFKALMAHSGHKLQRLNLHACRHISREAFEEVFNERAVYDELTHLEISFCEEVTDFILGSIFRACPKIREVNVFGCMKVRDIRVPRGVILVGVPNAQGMMVEGVD